MGCACEGGVAAGMVPIISSNFYSQCSVEPLHLAKWPHLVLPGITSPADSPSPCP